MALADPQSVTINGTATSLARIEAPTGGAFRSADGKITLAVRGTEKGRYRRLVQLRFEDIVSDPFQPDQNQITGTTMNFTADFPKTGMTTAQVAWYANALSAFLTPAVITKILVGEV